MVSLGILENIKKCDFVMSDQRDNARLEDFKFFVHERHLLKVKLKGIYRVVYETLIYVRMYIRTNRQKEKTLLSLLLFLFAVLFMFNNFCAY